MHEKKIVYFSALTDVNLNLKTVTTMLSLYKNTMEVGNDNRIPGIFSSEPALRYYIRSMLRKGVLVDKFVFFCTNEVLKNIDGVNLNQDNSDEQEKLMYLADVFGVTSSENNQLNEIKEVLRRQLSRAEAVENIGNYILCIQDTIRCIDELFDDNGDKNLEKFSTYDYVRAIIYYEIKKAGVISDNRYTGINSAADIKNYVMNATKLPVNNDNEIIVFSEREQTPNNVLSGIQKTLGGYKTSDVLMVSLDITGGSKLVNLSALLIAQWFENNWRVSKLCNIYYSGFDRNLKMNKAYLMDWMDSYRKFGIKELSVSGFDDPSKIEQRLYSFIEDSKACYDLKEINEIRSKVEDHLRRIENEDSFARQIELTHLCHKALAKLKMIKHGSIRDYVEQVLETPFVFISYSHKDYLELEKLIDIFMDKNININFVYDIVLELFLGINWDEVIENYITRDNCKGVLFYVSDNFLVSPSVFKEVYMVRELNKKSIPVSVNLENSIGDEIEKLIANGKMKDLIEIHEDKDPIEVLKEQFAKPTYLKNEIIIADNQSQKESFIEQVREMLK